MGVDIATRGNTVVLEGTAKRLRAAEAVIDMLWRKILKKQDVSIGDVDAAIRFATGETASNAFNANPGAKDAFLDEKAAIKNPAGRIVAPRSEAQKTYIEAIRTHEMVFASGPAGTGKTFLAVAAGVEMFKEGLVQRLVFSRPAVEAGERLGFLPGDMLEKIDPYLRPIFDSLRDLLPGDQVSRKIAAGDIEIAPLAFMRGRTLKNAFVVLDEAQNTTAMQMKMFLTRMGEGTRMVITGDPSQTDLPNGVRSGLIDALEILKPLKKEIAFVTFGAKDVVRHRLVGKIVEAYDKHDVRKTRHTD